MQSQLTSLSCREWAHSLPLVLHFQGFSPIDHFRAFTIQGWDMHFCLQCRAHSQAGRCSEQGLALWEYILSFCTP